MTTQDKLKLLDWARVPVGVMTNKGELRGTYTNSVGLCANVEVWSGDGYGLVMDSCEIEVLRLAPASEQKWIAVQDGDTNIPYEGLTYDTNRGRFDNSLFSYKVTGLVSGYTDNPELAGGGV